MVQRRVLLLAASLIAVGAAGDHIIQSHTGGTTPVAATTTKSPVVSQPVVQPAAYTTSSSQAVSAAAIDTATEGAYVTASQAVVYVDNLNQGTGSGIIFDSKGDIVTNNHVVDGSKKLKVTLNNGKTYTATVVGTDPVDDLAVIHINASNLTPATFATAGSYHVAQMVLAIGSPLGLKQSVTSGVISGLNRVEQEPDGAYLPNAIQTSAPINPGNSGGALVTLTGTVVGMPTLEQTGTSDGNSAQDIGFAIPSERIVSVASQIVATGKVEHTGRAYLGIVPSDSSSQGSYYFGQGFGGGFGPGSGQTTPSGAVVARVAANGPAAKAGLQQGDIITQAGGVSISDAQDLLSVLATKKPGDTITLKIDRNGSTKTVTVHLGELPA